LNFANKKTYDASRIENNSISSSLPLSFIFPILSVLRYSMFVRLLSRSPERSSYSKPKQKATKTIWSVNDLNNYLSQKQGSRLCDTK